MYLQGFNPNLSYDLGLPALYLAWVVVETAGHQPDDNPSSFIVLKMVIKSVIISSSPGCCEDSVSTVPRAPWR